ncbi:MAG: hypothetical protein EBR86_14560 [Planctomycetia bacterium]|nr:hypothetical protein [Planctomycetia bacterium]
MSIEWRGDAILVRVRSEGSGADQLPDAVFSFRCGDPQYAYWASRATTVEGSPLDGLCPGAHRLPPHSSRHG